MTRSFFMALATVFVAFPALAMDYESRDDADQGPLSHASLTEVRENLERQGYSDVVLADRNRFDRMIDVRATDPNGERIEIRLDNTTNIIRIRPMQ